MAGFTPEQEQMLKNFFEMLQKFGGATEKATKKIEELSDVASRGGPELEQALEDLRIEVFRKTKPEFGALTKEIITGKSTFKSMEDQIKRLDDAIEGMSDGAEKAQMMATRNALHDQEVRQRTRAELTTFTAQFGKTIVSGAASAVAGLVKGLQAGSSGTELASGMMTAAVDVATSGTKALGAGIAGVGGVMQNSLNPRMRMAGVAAGLAGSALGALGETAGKVAKFGIEVLSKEVEKTVKAFNETNAAGAVFADGMTGMRNAARGSGLTLEQFSKVVTQNSEALAQSGMGVVEGAKQVGRVGQELRKSGVTTQLLKLGYSFEEQAALTAETIANMRKAAGGTVSDAEVAKQTQKYAENLRLISQITGEDAKKRMEQVKQENAELAFQQKMATMSKEQRAQLNAAMATMTDQERKNFRDRMVFGEVINREGAIYEATIAGAREKGAAQARMAEEGNLTAESNLRLTAQYGQQIGDSIRGQQALGIAAYAGAESVKGAAAGMAQALDQSNNITTENVEAAIAAQEKAKNTQDKLTNDTVAAAEAAQNLKIQLEEVLTPAIAKFAEVSKQMLEAVQKMVNDALGKTGKQDTGPSTKDKAISAAVGAAEGAMTGAMIGSVVPAIGTGVGAAVGGVIGGIKGWFTAKEGKARGGIVSGPETGYLEKLHGEEAVIPTVGGRVPLDVTVPMADPAQVQQQLSEFGSSLDSKVDSLGGSVTKAFQPMSQLGKELGTPRVTNMPTINVSTDRLDTAGERLLQASERMSNASQLREPVDFAKTDFGGQLFDSLQASNKDLLLAGTQMSDAAKKMSAVGAKPAEGKGKSTETYTINGKPVTKDQFDKFMVENPELAQMMGSVKSKPATKTGTEEKKEQGLFDKLGLNTGTAVGAAIGTALLPGVGTLVGGAIGTFVDKGRQEKEQTGSMLDQVEQKLSSTFSDKGPVGTFFKDRGASIGTGMAAGAVVGGPLGAVVGGLTGLVTNFVQDKDAEKKRLADELNKVKEDTERTAKTMPGATGKDAEMLKGMLERFDQLLLVNQQQMKNQQDMLDTLARQKDIAERHYQASL